MAHPVRAQAGLEVEMVLRQGEALLLTILIPVGGLLVFGHLHLVPVPRGVPSQVNFVLAGAIAFGIMASGMVSQSITVAFDRSYGVLKRLGATPLGRRGIILAKLAAVITLELVQLVILLLVGAAMGWHPEGNVGIFVLGWLAATSAFAGLGLLLGGTLRAELVLGLATLAWLVLLGLGSIVVPLASLPAPLALVAKLLPAAGASEMILHGIAAASAPPLWAVLNIVAWGVAAPLAAARLFKWT
jgi:ABC-2 type transport system permease protein